MVKKVVIFVFYQTKSQANGGVNSLWQLIKSFDAISPILITNARTKVVEEAESLGFEVLITTSRDSFSVFARIFNLFFWSSSILKTVIQHRVSAIHFNDIIALSYGVLVAKVLKVFHFRHKLKLIFNIRDVFEPQLAYTKKWKLVNFCDEIIVLSNSMKEQLYLRLPLKNIKYWQDHMHAIYSIVDLERFCPVGEEKQQDIKHQLSLDPTQLHWAYVATFNTKKNQLGFIKELQEELKTHNVIVHFVGDINTYAHKCQTLVKELGLQDKCVFHGYYSSIEDFYRATDLTIVPTKREGLARCMIESLACKGTVVSFDVSSAEEILIANDCGLVVPQGNYELFFEQAYHLSQNKSQMDRFSKNGRNLANQLFSKQAIVASYQNIYLN
ncbi:glycosyltransferase family 4 protein [Marivirga sp. S37H4]|uniref:Glycosyltransferase family 4 protein n=1 Tax=Marivirga aurantiaca TaxID=2802615 RepID=A0A934WWS3_9BACT|nr:glycosyltransferase family 4 protein [Marivirga aurantiaca]MBK6264528.1 glycosyltransferase family 4 protein [Marivirga aurantiaca]